MTCTQLRKLIFKSVCRGIGLQRFEIILIHNYVLRIVLSLKFRVKKLVCNLPMLIFYVSNPKRSDLNLLARSPEFSDSLRTNNGHLLHVASVASVCIIDTPIRV